MAAIGCILVLLAALRGPAVGADTPSYIAYYNKLEIWSFEDFSSTRFRSYRVYFYLSKIFSLLALPCEVWFGFVELLYCISMYLLIKKFSSDYLFGALIFITSGLFLFSLAGMKQTLAMAFAMMAYHSFIDRRYISTIVLALLAYYSHPSSGVLMIAFILYLIRDNKYFIFIIIATFIALMAVGPFIFSTMIDMTGDEHFEMYIESEDQYTATTMIFYISVVAIALIGFKNYYNDKKAMALYMLGMSIIACGLQSFASFSANAFRLAYLYTPFFMIYIPNSINSIIKRNDRITVYLIEVACFAYYFLYTNRYNHYEFI